VLIARKTADMLAEVGKNSSLAVAIRGGVVPGVDVGTGVAVGVATGVPVGPGTGDAVAVAWVAEPGLTGAHPARMLPVHAPKVSVAAEKRGWLRKGCAKGSSCISRMVGPGRLGGKSLA